MDTYMNKEALINKYFPLSFMEGAKAALTGALVQGNEFAWRFFLMKDESTGVIHTYGYIDELNDESCNFFDVGALTVTENIVNQRYRIVPQSSRSELIIKGVNNYEYTSYGDAICVDD